MWYLILTALVIFSGYLCYVIKVAGIPYSISDTYYQLEKRGRKKWLFQLVMIAVAFLLLPCWLELSTENNQFLCFLSCSGLMFVGAAPCFKLRLDGKIHYIAAAICGVSAFIWTSLSGVGLIFLIMFSLIGIIFLIDPKGRFVFWLELGLFLGTFISLFIKYYTV